MQGKRPLVVYMSSSAHSDWRDPVREAYRDDPRVRFVGPCESHGLSDAMGSPGDERPGHKLRMTQMLSKADVLLAYIPDDQYRSFNVMIEIGMAHAWGRHVLFVNEARSLDVVVGSATPYVTDSYDSLDDGVRRLSELVATAPASPPQSAFTVGPPVQFGHSVYLTGSPDSRWLDAVRDRYVDADDVSISIESGPVALAQSDIVVACRTSAEGRLFNLCVAVGYARALGKNVLFVNEGDHYSHAYDYLKPFADGCYTDLAEALRYLDYALGIEGRL
ncbi:hypothetical protein HN371_13570 [Candidatus Poribacteria bacterium]|jgi:hypothetical protein|nr:hypothetical protein [Candidatus Poribacteria bacterium]MBT5535912.1 hypothetical protein [Candidatus Poribacteria bacterium]MBT5710852.1 hypothetical protein [Candidatus Poribacteria bacterium]MBT7100585.1 hypothetical protein [Candidatus Poribacteria bacterium]MBT7806906.1 hypothetical protein [Candidatus Poribacteria bacterium]